MKKSEEFLFESEHRICAAVDNLTAALSLIEGNAILEAEKRSALFRVVDTAKDELNYLKEEFTTAFDATFKKADAA